MIKIDPKAIEKLVEEILKDYNQEATFATKYGKECGAITAKDAAGDKEKTKNRIENYKFKLSLLLKSDTRTEFEKMRDLLIDICDRPWIRKYETYVYEEGSMSALIRCVDTYPEFTSNFMEELKANGFDFVVKTKEFENSQFPEAVLIIQGYNPKYKP